MKNKFFLFAATLMLFAACEQMEDSRNKPVPDNPKIAWLLSVEVDQLPAGTNAYSCAIVNGVNGKVEYTATRGTVNLPELLQIPGALLLRKNTTYNVGFNSFNPHAQDSTEINLKELTALQLPVVPDTVRTVDGNSIISINYPQKVRFENNGVQGYFHFRYD